MSAYGEGWQARAACTGDDQSLFHRPNANAAKAICRRCPVRAECLHDALEHDAPTGVWGGLSREERRELPTLPAGRTEAIAALREHLERSDSDEEERACEPKPAPRARVKPRERRRATPSPRRKKRGERKGTATATPKAPAVREDVAELLRQGATQRQIMKQLKVSGPVVTATRQAFGIPYPKGPGFRYTPEQRAENERRTLELLRSGATIQEIQDKVGISAPTILAIREKAGIPSPGHRNGTPPRTKAEGLAASIEPYGDGHARWNGPHAGRMPQLFAEGDRFNARHVVFEQHHGRPVVGLVRSNCGEITCIAGAHLTDARLRAAQPKEGAPVTVQALKDLLTEIDQQGGPQAARDNRLHLPDPTDLEPTPMTTNDAPAAPASTPKPAPSPVLADAEKLPMGKLLAWGDAHPDRDVQDQAARGRVILAGLRNRYATDQELAAITDQAAQLEKLLAELRARQAELAPPKKGRRPHSYKAAEVRAWAKNNGIGCPATGRVPKTVVDAWRQATGAEA